MPVSDLYALGILFYEMLVRRKPYHGETAVEILQQHVGAPLPRLPEELAGFQPMLDKLLAKKPNDRYDTAAQLVARWSEVERVETALARAESVESRFRQLNALFEARHLFPADPQRERENDALRGRWQQLREMLGDA